MRANRYVAVIVGAALAVSFALPGAVSAQEEKYLQGMRAFQQGNMPEAETIFREVCAEYDDAGVPWGWCHMMLGAVLGQQGPRKRQEALAELELAKELVSDDSEHDSMSNNAGIHIASKPSTPDEYKLSELLACMSIFMIMESHHGREQPKQWHKRNLEKIE